MMDLRAPIGWLFTLLGVGLSIYGLLSDPAIYNASLDINVNLWWGIVMAVFGLAMLAGASRSRSNGSGAAPDTSE